MKLKQQSEILGSQNKFEVRKLNKISINDLKELKLKGYKITRSAHIGNQYPSNIALIRAGINTFLVDKTDIQKDQNYKPSEIIVGGNKTKISSESSGLVCLAKRDVLLDSTKENPGIGFFHNQSIRKIFPDSNIFSATEFYVNNYEIINQILTGIIGFCIKNPSLDFDFTLLFDRYIVNGKFEKINKIGEKYIVGNNIILTKEDIFSSFINLNNNLFKLLTGNIDNKEFEEIKSKSEGSVCSNNFNIVLLEVINCILSGKNEVYHCSGPDFINYCEQNLVNYDIIYDIIKKTSGLKLPENIIYNLIPTALLKFITLDAGIRENIINIFENKDKFASTEQEKREKINLAKNKGENIQEIIKNYNNKAQEIKDEIKRLLGVSLNSLTPEYILGHIKLTNNYFTQYDLNGLSENELNNIFNGISDIKLDEIGKIIDEMKKLK